MTQRGTLTPEQRKRLVAARTILLSLVDPMQVVLGTDRDFLKRVEEMATEIEELLGY